MALSFLPDTNRFRALLPFTNTSQDDQGDMPAVPIKTEENPPTDIRISSGDHRHDSARKDQVSRSHTVSPNIPISSRDTAASRRAPKHQEKPAGKGGSQGTASATLNNTLISSVGGKKKKQGKGTGAGELSRQPHNSRSSHREEARIDISKGQVEADARHAAAKVDVLQSTLNQNSMVEDSLRCQLKDSQAVHAQEMKSLGECYNKTLTSLEGARNELRNLHQQTEDQIRALREQSAYAVEAARKAEAYRLGEGWEKKMAGLHEDNARKVGATLADLKEARAIRDSLHSQLCEVQETHARDIQSMKDRDDHIRALQTALQNAQEEWKMLSKARDEHVSLLSQKDDQLRGTAETHAHAIQNAREEERTRVEEQWRQNGECLQESHAREVAKMQTELTGLRTSLDKERSLTDNWEALYHKSREAEDELKRKHKEMEEKNSRDLETIRAALLAANRERESQKSQNLALQNQHAREISVLKESQSREIQGIQDAAKATCASLCAQKDRQLQEVLEERIRVTRRDEAERADKFWKRELEKIFHQSTRTGAVPDPRNAKGSEGTRPQDSKAPERDIRLDASHAELLQATHASLRSIQEDYAALRQQVRLDESPEPLEVRNQFLWARTLMERVCGDLSERWDSQAARARNSTHTIQQPARIKTLNLPLSVLMLSSPEGRLLGDVVDRALPAIANSIIFQSIYAQFHPSLDVTTSNAVSMMYEKIRRTERQIAAGKWRKQAYEALDRQLPPNATHDLIDKVVHSITASWVQLFDLVDGKNPSKILHTSDTEALREAVAAALEWNNTRKCKSIDSDFVPVMFDHDSRFDDLAMGISKRSPRPDKITCTLHPGLQVSEAVGGGVLPPLQWLEKMDIDF